MVPVFIVFVTLALLYRLVMWLMSKSEKLEDMLEGNPSLSLRTDSWPGKMSKAPI